MKTVILLLSLLFLNACAHVGTPEQQEAARIRRGKNIAKIQKAGGNFLTNLAIGFLSATAQNLAHERGFRK